MWIIGRENQSLARANGLTSNRPPRVFQSDHECGQAAIVVEASSRAHKLIEGMGIKRRRKRRELKLKIKAFFLRYKQKGVIAMDDPLNIKLPD
jgi:hypothetical protein